MTESVYNVITIVGTSAESWEKAAKAAIEKATKTTRDLRVAEIAQLDMKIENGKVNSYSVKVKLSFRVENIDESQFYKDPATWFLEKEHHSLDG
jgi:flavin-binding protein dodecin